MAEPIISNEPIYSKKVFVKSILNFVVDEPQPSLTEIVHDIRRILDAHHVINQWYLFCLETIRSEFQLFAQLSSTKSYSLIKSIFKGLQKYSFVNDKVDKVTEEKWQEYLSRCVFSSSRLNTNA
ncbi:unnamed protein product [Rotaria socialis]|uniref:Uncharacterized protein n=1 Tax=Rotaria socialis TaxID=392032 RepID=A0A818BD46_9BILA|nr:unnamed protein product [Rotaria socialis]CAF3418329.1 unnamed protein product [Rotaria socialis]CAF3706181.1 unnamed protein product [Rotaria socialis]CAF3718386.1 unnamed protein product [Rotaria socialis]CAF3778126.1 unnamed protein product [Rotaria socialis]